MEIKKPAVLWHLPIFLAVYDLKKQIESNKSPNKYESKTYAPS